MRFLTNPRVKSAGMSAVGGVLGAIIMPVAIRYGREAKPAGAAADYVPPEKIYFDSAKKAGAAGTPASYVRWRLAGTVWSLGLGLLGIIGGFFLSGRYGAIGGVLMSAGFVSTTLGLARGFGLQFVDAKSVTGQVTQRVGGGGNRPLFGGAGAGSQAFRNAPAQQRAPQGGGGTIPVIYTS
jgi:hypothetical protein